MKTSSEPSVETSTVSLAEASRLLAKPENTIREWIKSKKLQAFRDTRGRWLIKRHDLMAFVATKASSEPRSGASSKTRSHVEPSTVGSTEGSTERYVRCLEDSLERERRINDELRAKIQGLEQERNQHMAEMRALLSKDLKDKSGTPSRWFRR
jgi:excisionase family DNA binding protein